MFDSLYKDYFQKSRMFLYPLLEIKRGVCAVPAYTYIQWEGKHALEDAKFICCYDDRSDAEFLQFEKTTLLTHNRLINKQKINNFIIYTFDFNDCKSDWLHFVNGNYSKLTEKIKRKILNFFDKNSSNYVYMESYLFPEKYFKLYSDLLKVDIELLKEVGELCSKPDISKESFKIENLKKIVLT
jgi:hypothetical protein